MQQYTPVITKLLKFFKVNWNVIFECARFNWRNQLEGEFDPIQSRGDLAETTESWRRRCYGTAWWSVGIRDTTLSLCLQMEVDLTLKKAKKIVQQKEAVREQHLQLQGQGPKKDPIVLNKVRHKPQTRKGGASSKCASTMPQEATVKNHSVVAAGKSNTHNYDKCPAKGTICRRCNRKGHFEAQCFLKTTAASTDELSMESAFLDTVATKQVNRSSAEE